MKTKPKSQVKINDRSGSMYPTVDVHFNELTLGEAVALCHALNTYAASGSAVANDLVAFLRNALFGLTRNTSNRQLGPAERAALEMFQHLTVEIPLSM